jgi:hypothetical protein
METRVSQVPMTRCARRLDESNHGNHLILLNVSSKSAANNYQIGSV